jgi:hypothetical protein
VSCRVVSCRVVSCRVVSCRVVLCRVVSCPAKCDVVWGVGGRAIFCGLRKVQRRRCGGEAEWRQRRPWPAHVLARAKFQTRRVRGLCSAAFSWLALCVWVLHWHVRGLRWRLSLHPSVGERGRGVVFSLFVRLLKPLSALCYSWRVCFWLPAEPQRLRSFVLVQVCCI